MKIINFRLPFNHSSEDYEKALSRLGLGRGQASYLIKRSLDARQKHKIVFEYMVGIGASEPLPQITPLRTSLPFKPVIVGAGPAGLFTALRLLEHGLPSIVVEQGEPVKERSKTVARFIREGVLNEHSNISFGAGGAGTFSDGKLMTRIRSPYIPYFMDSLIRFGALEEIRYLHNPHLGTNKMRTIIQTLIQYLEQNGVAFHFNTLLQGLHTCEENGKRKICGLVTTAGEIKTSALFLACGHSARPLYRLLQQEGFALQYKPFAVGLRMEHPAALIDQIQFGSQAGHPVLGHAEYKLAYTWKEKNRGVYSFCMCPGGYILNAATSHGGVVSNGMSNWKRSGKYSNAAIVVSVSEKDIPGEDVFKGIDFQNSLEQAFAGAVNKEHSSHCLPAMRMLDFIRSKPSSSLPTSSALCPVAAYPLYKLFPEEITQSLQSGFKIFSDKMKGLMSSEALLLGVESRTSSPLRILRDENTLESLSVSGVYPLGEGAGYAGGITSSAVDGVLAADTFRKKIEA